MKKNVPLFVISYGVFLALVGILEYLSTSEAGPLIWKLLAGGLFLFCGINMRKGNYFTLTFYSLVAVILIFLWRTLAYYLNLTDESVRASVNFAILIISVILIFPVFAAYRERTTGKSVIT